MRVRAGLALAVTVIGTACSSPPSSLYTLAPVPGAPVSQAVRSVELRRIGLAGYLDRPEIVRSNARYRLDVLTNERWGEPMGTMLDRVLTEDLVERLPSTAVFAESGAITTQPEAVLEIDIQRLDADSSGAVVLLAQVAIRRDQARTAGEARTVRLSAVPTSGSTQDLVAAMSNVLAQLADSVAINLRR